MINVMLEGGLPLSLVRLINRTHENTTLNVRENNKLGQTMKTNTGIFQGSPLSALLFVIYITSMMANFRTNKLTPDNNQRVQHNRQPNHLHGEPANLFFPNVEVCRLTTYMVNLPTSTLGKKTRTVNITRLSKPSKKSLPRSI